MPDKSPAEQDLVPPSPEHTGALRASFMENLRFLITVGVLAVLLRSLLFAPFSIPSESMLPRLLVGDYLFVAKWPYGYSRYSFPFGLAPIDGRIFGRDPERGDIVVFKYPRDNRQDYIKRLIGLPGDLVQVRSGQLFLNGQPVPRVRMEDFRIPQSPNTKCRGQAGSPDFHTNGKDGVAYCRYPQYRETLPGGRSYLVLDQTDYPPADDTPVYIVPAGHYFMMGDNRDDSADSRFPISAQGVGFVPEENLVGRATVMFFSTDGSAEWLKPWTWFTAVRWDRIGRVFN